MNIIGKILLAPFAWIYGAIVDIRHKMFDWNVLRHHEFDIPIVCVGNITVGGTGKTPHTEYLIETLSPRFKVAVLARGYKRKTKGFQLASTTSSFKRIGDEPKQIKLKYPNVPVAVCEKRADGIRKLRELHPEVNLIILDDAFQHRYVEPWVSIVLIDYNRPIYEDLLLPMGRLRDRRSQLSRAQVVVVTKCPTDLRPLDYRIISKKLELPPYQSLYFTHFESSEPEPLFADNNLGILDKGSPVIALSGIANPSKFLNHLHENYTVVSTVTYPDHYTFKLSDIAHLGEQLKELPPETAVVMTEKDAVRLINSKKIDPSIRRRLYYISIRVQFLEDKEHDFQRQLEKYVTKNQKYDILHPE